MKGAGPREIGINPQYFTFYTYNSLNWRGKSMKRTAALHALVTALILFTATGIQYFADWHERALLSAQGTADMESQSVPANRVAACRELDRDEKTLAGVTIVAAGFLVVAIVSYRLKDSEVAEYHKVTITP
jgi:hypothetical protein